MTTKQIAEAVGKPEKTVRTWAAKVAAKSAEATAKMAVNDKMSSIGDKVSSVMEKLSARSAVRAAGARG